jgi:ABC-type multidrug transport system permease subunit
VFSLIFVSIFYFMIDFGRTGAQFWLFWLVTFLVGLTYQYAGMMMAGLFPNIVVSQVVGGMTLAVYFLFGGVFISPQYIIKYWKWFYYVDFESWAVRALSMDQFYCEGPSCTQVVVPTPTAFTPMSAYDYISGQLEFYNEDKWRAVGVLAGICCLYFGITTLVFKVLNHLKR